LRSGVPSAVRRTEAGAFHGFGVCAGGVNATGGFEEFAPTYHVRGWGSKSPFASSFSAWQ
jgi:hypothetical protein